MQGKTYLRQVEGAAHHNTDGPVTPLTACSESWVIPSHSVAPHDDCIRHGTLRKHALPRLRVADPCCVACGGCDLAIQSHSILQCRHRYSQHCPMQQSLHHTTLLLFTPESEVTGDIPRAQSCIANKTSSLTRMALQPCSCSCIRKLPTG